MRLRRILASGLSVLLVGVFTICPTFAASSFPDVDENAAYAEAVEYLNDIGIMQGDDKGNFNPDKNVTRAEMAAIICRMLYEDASATDGTVFSDVPASHWANGYVTKVAELGIVNGYGNGKFGPSDTVTYEQAIAMVVRAKGLDEYAITAGGYPNGYIAVAQEYGFGQELNVSFGDLMPRREIAVLLYSAMV